MVDCGDCWQMGSNGSIQLKQHIPIVRLMQDGAIHKRTPFYLSSCYHSWFIGQSVGRSVALSFKISFFKRLQGSFLHLSAPVTTPSFPAQCSDQANYYLGKIIDFLYPSNAKSSGDPGPGCVWPCFH